MLRIKLLFIAANPAGWGNLNLDADFRGITEKINGSQYRDAFEILPPALAARVDDLFLHLNKHQPHIVHFSGHGSTDGELILVGNDGNAKPLSAEALTATFEALNDNIKLVLLNACYSKIQAEAIASVIDCVIGMNAPVDDDAAIHFAETFYQALGFGRSVGNAFKQGKARVLADNSAQAKVPELLVKTGVDANALLLINSNALPVPPPAIVPPIEIAPSVLPVPNNAGVDRAALVATLNRIVPPQLTLLTGLLNMPGSVQPGGPATHADKVDAFVRWAEAPGGCGLVKVKAALDELTRNPH